MKLLLTVLIIWATRICVVAQVNTYTPQQVKNAIIAYDSTFWKAYNDCDTSTLEKFISDDVEFYHDISGLTAGNKALMESIKKNLCSNGNYHLRREPVKGTVNVYLLQNNGNVYGAVISGSHLFYVWEKGKKEFLDGNSQFTHVWMYYNKSWKMTRILSYDHRSAN